VVGCVWPNDPDGLAHSAALTKKLNEAGYTVIDPGRHPFGMQDYGAFIDS
jgi:hypothetical protein